MFNLEVVTPPAAGPVTAEDLRGWMRLNDTSEDATLDELLAAAVDRFELEAKRPVLATVYRQYLDRWPCSVVLGRGGVTAVAGVSAYQADGTTVAAVSPSAYAVNLKTAPARVRLAYSPAVPNGPSGLAVSPVGYVTYTAGWATAAAVPKPVLVALKQLAAHWYEHREAYAEGTLGPVAKGWAAVVAQHTLGLSGAWGQQSAPAPTAPGSSGSPGRSARRRPSARRSPSSPAAPTSGACSRGCRARRRNTSAPPATSSAGRSGCGTTPACPPATSSSTRTSTSAGGCCRSTPARTKRSSTSNGRPLLALIGRAVGKEVLGGLVEDLVGGLLKNAAAELDAVNLSVAVELDLAALSRLKGKHKRAVIIGCNRAAKPVRLRVISEAEKVARYGYSAKSIGTKTRVYAGKSIVTVIGPKMSYARTKGSYARGPRKGQARRIVPYLYAWIVNKGTTPSAKRDYLARAWQAEGSGYLDRVAGEIAAELAKLMD